MPALVRRQAVVALLILAAAVAAMALRVDGQPAPSPPALAALIDAGRWRVDSITPDDPGLDYRQALLLDGSGHRALLYLGVTSRIQSALRWSGELGFQGEGYLVTARRDAWVTVRGRPAPVAEVTLEHLADRRLVESAVVGPHGIARQARDLLWGAVWDLARSRASTYYLVRASVAASDADAGARADQIMAVALSRLG
jgi:hypothetical protein